MSEITRLTCPSCAAGIEIAEGTRTTTCKYCGSQLAVRMEQGEAVLRLSEQVREAVEASAAQTVEAVREGTEKAQAEFDRVEQARQRTHLEQQLSTARQQLSSLESELRLLQREKYKTWIVQSQIAQLQARIAQAQAEILDLRKKLGYEVKLPRPPQRRRKKSAWLWIMIAFILAVICAGCTIVGVIPFIAALFSGTQ